jgi:hypothetical protein
MSRDPVRAGAMSFIVLMALLLAPQPSSGSRAAALGGPEPVAIEIGRGTYHYLPLHSGELLTFSVEGPTVFEPIMRWRFETPSGGEATGRDGAGAASSRAPGSVAVDVEFWLDGRPLWHRVFTARPGDAAYPDDPASRPGEAVRASVYIPSGIHIVEMSLASPGEGTLDVNPVTREPLVLPWRFVWRGEVGTAYDSNIYRYADEDVEDFLDGRRPERFPNDYLDDLRLEPSLDLMLVREEPGRRETELRLSADYRLATVNTEKSFGKLGGRVTESWRGLGHVLLDYYMIPSYHIRYLWDPDVEEGSHYRSCDFRKNAVRLGVGTDWPHIVDIAADLSYDRTGYGPDFVEYDSDAWTTGATAIVRPLRGLRIDASYAFRRSVARGYDEVGETRETSDDSDISYEQDEYGLRTRWAVGRLHGVPVVLTAGGKLSRRFYSTDRSPEADPYHAGRDDTYMTLWVRSSWQLTESTALEGFYVLRTRAAESAFNEEIGALKDYTAHRVGIRLIIEGERFLD